MAWVAAHTLGKAAGLCPFPVCLFKCVTGYACPGCGSTRGLVAIFHGHVAEAIFRCNALSVIEAPVFAAMPVLLLVDAIGRKAFLYRFWMQTERWLKRPVVAISVVGLVLANWIWNLSKGL